LILLTFPLTYKTPFLMLKGN